MLLCICVSAHVSVNASLIFGAFMKLQSILAIFIVILLLSCGVFPWGYRLVWQRLVQKFVVEREFTKMGFFYLFWWFQTFGLYLLDSMFFLGPVFSH